MSVYGIDLGTTNSLLGQGDKLLTGLVPSIVDLDTKKVGTDEKYNVNAARSFKVDISMGDEGLRSILASAEVLKELKRQAGLSGRIQCVITVPAEFDDNQRKATMKAAEHANIDVVALVNEPTAAAMYVTQGKKKVAVVFDLGGGTFDVSVIDSRFGNYDVQYSAGNSHLGGDNLDKLIMQHFVKAGKIQLFRLNKEQQLRLKLTATHAKIRMQNERKDFTVNLREFGAGTITFKEENYKALMQRAFMKCITQLHQVLNAAIEYGTPFDMVMVGGSTRCPYLREWVAMEVGQEPVPLTYDPDLAVAYGAALYAKMWEDGEIDFMVSDITKALSVGLSDGTVMNVIPSSSKVPISEEVMLTNPVDAEFLDVALYQGDSGLAKNNYYIGNLIYPYGSERKSYTAPVVVTVDVDVSGVVHLSCKEIGKEPVVKELVLS
ncbi:MAG: Hsp70 family protein [Roseburia sp.]|nr:Hsp70 family protein [Roseburia sp.]